MQSMDFLHRYKQLRSSRFDRHFLWLRIGNNPNRVLFARLQPLLSEAIDALKSGKRLVKLKRV
jgi:hypothetical protein